MIERSLKILAMAASLWPMLGYAALPPRSADDLQLSADAVVVGVVEAIDKVDEAAVRNFANTNYSVAVRVELAEKGEPGGVIIAGGWVQLARPEGWAGPYGVHGLGELKSGQHVRLYLRRLAGGGYEILQPNGLATLELMPVVYH